MKKIAIKGHIIEFYEPVLDSVPSKSLHNFNKFCIIESNTGGGLDSVMDMINKAVKLINTDNKAKAVDTLNNLSQSITMVVEQIDPLSLAFASVVYSINDIVVTDRSPEGVRDLIHSLTGITREEVAGFVVDFKKKIADEMEIYFPEKTRKGKLNSYYSAIKNKALAICDSIINDTDDEEIKLKDAILMRYLAPIKIDSDFEVQYDKDYANLCLSIDKEMNTKIENDTAFKFYQASDFVKKLYKNGGK